jgi:hypothetical protein
VQLLSHRDLYSASVQQYDAQVYIKGNSEVKKKNFLFRYVSDYLYFNKSGKNRFVEALVDMHFTAPNYFTQNIQVINGGQRNIADFQDRLMQFLNINIYHPTLFNDQIVMPGVKNAFQYYEFDYIRRIDTLQQTIHQIRATPKISSPKLISGIFNIVDGLWTVSSFSIDGQWEWYKFHVETEFSLQQEQYLLPVKSDITFSFKMLGNQTVNRYFSQFEYRSIKRGETHKEKQSYDLSQYFEILSDSVPIVRDSAFWATKRPVPLSEYELSLLENRKRTTPSVPDSSVTTQFLQFFDKRGVMSTNFQHNNDAWNYSGLLNPFKLSYSHTNGVVYAQEVTFLRQYDSGRELRWKPEVDILFYKKELYFKTPVAWLFAPRHFGTIYATFGNQNQAYTSSTTDKINETLPDSLRFEDFDLDYYRHYHSVLGAKYELINGLVLTGGVHYDWYVPVQKKAGNPQPSWSLNQDLKNILRSDYCSLAPTIGLQWTPHQYYRYDGKKKMYVDSHYPTFFAEYSRGIKGILKSNSNYERIELDMQQKISLGLLRSLHYYVGTGWFTYDQSGYFVDFNNFQQRNVPESWNDPIGGVFHLLDSEWYYATRSYAQLHLMYESPFSLFQLLRYQPFSFDVMRERLYLSQLYTPILPSYTELGYAVGNFVGNAGVFVSFKKLEMQAVGFKFSLELDL